MSLRGGLGCVGRIDRVPFCAFAEDSLRENHEAASREIPGGWAVWGSHSALLELGPAPAGWGATADLVEEYRHLLEDAVRLQLRSDVPLGLFLSSGIDSGMLLAIMRQQCPTPIQTFTIGFEEAGQPGEAKEAKERARAFGALHYDRILGPEDFRQYFDRFMWDLEEPVGNMATVAFYFVSKIAREHVKVVLTGQGADEPWAGYDRYKGVKLSGLYSRLPHLLTDSIPPLLAKIPGRLERLRRGVQSLADPDILSRFTKIYSIFSPEMRARMFTGAMKAGLEADPNCCRRVLQPLHGDVDHLDPLAQMLYIDTRTSLPDDLLMVGDKMSMANSLEARMPFLDYRVVEFVESLPSALKLNGWTSKYLHKKAAEKWLAPEVVYRKKIGFANPIENWFRASLSPFVDDCLLSPDSCMAQYFDQKYIRQMVELDRAGKAHFRRQIYLLVSLELWHRSFMGR